MQVKMILPALAEAESPFWRPIKYSLFPPLGLATLAGHFSPDDNITLVDQHIEQLTLDDRPDLVLIQIYITNASRAYSIADYYRSIGCYVVLGGLHVTALPQEAAAHADSIFIGPADTSFPQFLCDYTEGNPRKVYYPGMRDICSIPEPRRDLIKRKKYLVPNSLVVSRGCPHHCSFCYKDQFYHGGKSYYTQRVDRVLQEISSLPGRHLFFLDDHLFGNEKFCISLFEGMKGMNRVFQAAATVQTVLKGGVIKKAAEAGLRSLFIGFESLSDKNMQDTGKLHNRSAEYQAAVQTLHDLGIMINGSFVFGLEADGPDVFERTVEWGIQNSITTATYHILTPYPGTKLFSRLQQQGRITSRDWDKYDTRHVVFHPAGMSAGQLQEGYHLAYRQFYQWKNIWRAATGHEAPKQMLKHLIYTGGWKKFEPVWNFIIKTGCLNEVLPLLEALLSNDNRAETAGHEDGKEIIRYQQSSLFS